MESLNFEPLKITATLRSAVVADQWLPLDAMLLYQMTRDDLGARTATQSGASALEQPKGQPMKGGKLPIKTVHGKEWYYRCSWAEWGPCVDGRDYWNKRFDSGFADLLDFRERRGTVNNLAGQFKAYHQPIFYRSALWVCWYCVGDRREIERLLSTLTHVGKKLSQGWGRVASWLVEGAADDWSILREGKLMRGVPVGDAPRDYAGNVALYGVRPSYWDRRNQINLVMP